MKRGKFKARYWLLGCTCIAFVLYWFFIRIPYRPEIIYKAIPSDVQLMSSHENLADRWQSILKHPLLKSIAVMLNQEPEALQQMSEDPVLNRWFQRLSSDKSVLAYTQRIGQNENPAWLFSTWIGYRNIYLPFLVRRYGGTSIQPLNTYRNYELWEWIIEGKNENYNILLAAGRGVLLGCISEDASVLQVMLDAFDGIHDSVVSKNNSISKNIAKSTAIKTNYGIVNPPYSPFRHPIKYSFNFQSDNALKGVIQFERTQALISSGDVNYFDEKYFLRPDKKYILGLTTLNVKYLQDAIAYLPQGSLKESLSLRASVQTNKHLSLALLGEEFTAKYFLLKVPSIIIRLPIENPSEASQIISQILKSLNMTFPINLTLEEQIISGTKFFALNGINLGHYNIKGKDRPAYIIQDKHLWIASSLHILDQLLNKFPSNLSDSFLPVSDQKMPSNRLWLDIDGAAQSIKPILGAYIMTLMFDRSSNSHDKKEIAMMLKSLLETLSFLDTFQLKLSETPPYEELHFLLKPYE